MNTTWVFNDCDADKQRAKAYWHKKSGRFERLLSNYRPELRRIRLTLYRHESRDAWELRAVVHLPTGTLVSEETSKTLTEVIDAVADDLSRAVRRHKSQVRKDHLIRRRRRRREQLTAAEPFLAKDSSADRPHAFTELLLPHMDQVRAHAKRELASLESEGVIPKGEWTARDLVHEVLLLACESFDKRPKGKSLDIWLLQLSNRCLDQLTSDVRPISMVASNALEAADVDDGSDLDDIQYWLRHILEPADDVALDELLSDDSMDAIWERLSEKEQREQVDDVLHEFPKHQRQALILHDAYGFELDEIAAALDRSRPDVEADLVNGREKVRLALSNAEPSQ